MKRTARPSRVAHEKQLSLDFFDPSPVAAPAASAAPTTRPDGEVSAPAVSLDEAIAPALWAHPRASRQIAMGTCVVAYEFKRGKRRTIGLVVGQDGLSVSAPRWTPIGEVEDLLRQKAAWVLEKLQAARERRAQTDRARIHWRDGVVFPWLGRDVTVALDPECRASAALDEAPAGPRLRLGLPHHASEPQIRDLAQAWLMREAERVFTERLHHFATLLGVRWTRLRLSSAGTRWGSASADGVIRLNWRLIHFRLDVIDYVVAHELSHLRVMDHSPRFWDTVAQVLPDYGERREELNRLPVPKW